MAIAFLKRKAEEDTDVCAQVVKRPRTYASSPQGFPLWPELLPELQNVIRTQHLDRCARACLAMTCRQEASQRSARPTTWALCLMSAAIRDHHLDILRALHGPDIRKPHIFPDGYEHHLQIHAAYHGNMPAVEFLLGDMGYAPDAEVLEDITAKGTLADMKRVHELGCALSKYAMAEAAALGDLAKVVWLLEKGCRMGKFVFECAAGHGDLLKLRLLAQLGCPISHNAMYQAVKNGSVEMLDWLDERGAADVSHWSALYINAAGRTDGLAPVVMAWLMLHDCPMDAQLYLHVVERGHSDAARWLADHGCPTTY